jgi:serine/threonine protein kinase
VLVRAHSPAQAKRWGWLLERAAKLRTDDLFEYVPLKGLDESLHGTALVKASELGRGRFAVVRRARRRRYPKEREGGRGEEGHRGTVCALKVVNKAAFWQRVAEGKERHDTLVREVLAQALLTAQCFQAGMSGQTCPIVRLFSAFETCDSVVLELELMSRNDLFDELSTSGVLKEHKTAGIVNQVRAPGASCVVAPAPL